MALRLPRLKVFWDEMIAWTAFTLRVVTVIQRAWRFYLARRAMSGAAKNSMISRLKCAKMVGKMAGFCKNRDLQKFMQTPESAHSHNVFTYVESQDLPVRTQRTNTPRPRGICMVCDDADRPSPPKKICIAAEEPKRFTNCMICD
jgi:hypothetical protein